MKLLLTTFFRRVHSTIYFTPWLTLNISQYINQFIQKPCYLPSLRESWRLGLDLSDRSRVSCRRRPNTNFHSNFSLMLWWLNLSLNPTNSIKAPSTNPCRVLNSIIIHLYISMYVSTISSLWLWRHLCMHSRLDECMHSSNESRDISSSIAIYRIGSYRYRRKISIISIYRDNILSR